MQPRGVVLDAGAFIAFERRDTSMIRIAKVYVERKTPLVTSAAVVAQVWRGGERAQVPIAFLLRHTTVVSLDLDTARVLGRMLAAARGRDPIDAHVVFLAHTRGWPVLTSDPRDLRALDKSIAIERI